jgi:hypothetical protein
MDSQDDSWSQTSVIEQINSINDNEKDYFDNIDGDVLLLHDGATGWRS